MFKTKRHLSSVLLLCTALSPWICYGQVGRTISGKANMRTPASIPGETKGSTALEIKGESRNLDMVLSIEDSDEIDFIEMREDYRDENLKLYQEPNF